MAEILTESFCERCGTRYTFEAAIPKKHRIGKLKVLSKGLRNYVLSEDASLDEALAEARSEEERELSGGQLDAFHQTFQFCMSCRQYTCANCWNEAEGRCLSCAPLSFDGGQLRSPLDDLLAGGGISPFTSPAEATAAPDVAARSGNGHAALDEPVPPALVGSAWPTIDLFRSPDNAQSFDTESASPSAAEPPLAAPAAEAAPVAEDAEATAGAPSDFWTRPFTGFAPVPEAGNGHDASAAELAAPIEEPSPEPLAEPTWAEPAAEPTAELAAFEAAAAPETPVEAPLAPDAHVKLAAAQPEQAPPPVETPSDPVADERAAELAERTTRLLGRFRVQPRSAASAARPMPIDDTAAATIPSAPPPIAPPIPAPITQTPAAPPVQPAWMSVTPEPVAALAAEPVAAAEPEPEPVQVLEPEAPVVADVEPIQATEPEPAPIAEPEPAWPGVAAAPPEAPAEIDRPQLRPAAIDRIEMPAWPTPARPPLSDSGPIPPAVTVVPPAPAPSPPTLPVVPQWPAPQRPDLDVSSTPFWASEAGRADAAADVWSASAREVAGAPGQAVSPAGVQSCVSCGLSLSANARFCRRCGSRQG